MAKPLVSKCNGKMLDPNSEFGCIVLEYRQDLPPVQHHKLHILVDTKPTEAQVARLSDLVDEQLSKSDVDAKEFAADAERIVKRWSGETGIRCGFLEIPVLAEVRVTIAEEG